MNYISTKVRSIHGYGDLSVGEEKIVEPYTRQKYQKVYSNVRYWNKTISGINKEFIVVVRDKHIIVRREK